MGQSANFFAQEDIGGANTDAINDAERRNAPDTTASMRGHPEWNCVEETAASNLAASPS